MNFKYLVIVIYLSFVALIVMMVLKSCNQKIDLETKNYYNEELKYQDQIDAKLAGNFYLDSFNIYEKEGMVLVSTPSSIQTDSIVLNFKKPDNALADKKYVFSNSVWSVKKDEFASGFYDLDILAYQSGKPLLIEKRVKF